MKDIKAIIFDMDGVLVNSEPVITQAAIEALRELGADPKEEDFIPFVGTGEDSFIGGVAKKYDIKYHKGMKNRTYDIYDEIVFEKIGLYDGVSEALSKLKNKGYVLALASAADKRKVIINLKAANIDMNIFNVVLSGDDVINKKPAPDVYNLAAERLKIDNDKCIVVEDALKGILSAHSANMKVIGITTAFTKEQMTEGGADYIMSFMPEIVDIL